MATRTISTKLAVEGESQYKQAITNINSELKMLDSRLKLVQSEFKGQQNTIEALQAKGKALSEVHTKQTEKVRELEDAYANAKTAAEGYAARSESLKHSLEDNEKTLSALSDETKRAGEQWNSYKAKLESAEGKLEKLQNSSKNTTAAQKELEQEIVQTKAAMARLEEETGGAASAVGGLIRENKNLTDELETNEAYLSAAAKGANNWERQLNNAKVQLNGTNDEIKRNDKYLTEAARSADGCATSIDGMGKEAKEAGDKGTQAFEDMYGAITALGLVEGIKKIGQALAGCVKAAGEFEYQMATVKSLSGAAGEEMAGLTDKAKELGATTSFTATQAGEAMEYMALAGWKTGEMMEGIGGILDLAAAAAMDLGTASDIVTDNLTAFGLTAKDSGQLADQMAYAMSHSNTNVSQLGEAYKNCAAASTQMGYSLEDTTAALMVMADAGLKGGEAGTALASIMTRLGNNVSGCRDLLEEYGVRVYDTQGNVKSLSGILEGMREVWGGLNDEQKSNLSYIVAGKTAQTELMTLLGESTGSFEVYAAGLKDCSGAAKEMADVKLDTYAGQVILLQSAWDGLAVTVGEDLTPVLGMGIKTLTEVLTVVNDLVAEHPEITAAVVGITAALAALAAGALLTSEVVAGKLVPALTATAAAALANPFVLAATAVAGLAAAIVVLHANMEDASGEQAMRQAAAEMREEAEELILAIKEEQETFKALKSETQDTADACLSMADELDELAGCSRLTAAEQERMLYIIGQLNETYPELALAYDGASDSLNMSTEAVRKYVEEAAKQESLSQDAARYNEVLDERARISREIEEAEAALDEAQAARSEALEKYTGAYDIYLDQMINAEDACKNAKEAVESLRESDAQLSEEEETLKASINAANEELAKMETAAGAANGAAGAMAEQMAILKQEYDELYAEALESIHGQFSLWNELEDTVAMSSGDILTALESQTRYWAEYADNLEDLNGRNIDGLNSFVAAVDDGSTEAAAYIAGLAQMSDEELMSLVDQTYPALIEAQGRAAESSAEMATGFSGALEEMEGAAAEGVEKMDLSDEAREAAKATARGYTEGMDEESEGVKTAAGKVAQAGIDSFKGILGINSPSTVYREMGNNTIQGYVDGVNGGKEKLFSVMGNVAGEALNSAKTVLTDSAFREIGKTTMTGTQSGISQNKNVVLMTMGNAANEALNSAKTVLTDSAFREIGKTTMTGTQSGISQNKSAAAGEMSAAATEVYGTAQNGLSADKFRGVGVNIIEGLKSGINSAVGGLAKTAADAALSAYNAAKSSLGIQSPSKSFAYLGRMTGEGYIVGWQESMAGIDRLISDTLPDPEKDTGMGGWNSRRESGQAMKRTVVNQEIHIHAKTDSLIDTARRFEESQREAALEW